MRKWFRKGIAVFCATAIVFSSAYVAGTRTESEVKAAGNYDGWNLVWSDEFEGTELNRNNWNVEVNGSGMGNNEQQFYIDSTNNIQVSDGTLKITARKEYYNGKAYTSGRINTLGKQEFKYGKIEARMKLPRFAGIWPAFWTLGANYSSVGWPACGEMDIMEAINDNNIVFANLHWSYNNSQADTQNGRNYDVGDRTEWHTYGMEWSENSASFYVDDYVYQTYSISTSAQMEEFRKKQFIILNLAVGGQLPGYNIDNTQFPATMEVDWVRVYQKPEEQTTKYNGPTITVEQDAIDEYTGSWTSFFGQTWCNAYGEVTQNGDKVSDGATVHVTRAGTIGGDSQWSVQAKVENLKYYANNTYTLKCTLLSDVNKKVFVKIAGDDEEAISGEYITLQSGVPYYYTKEVYIAEDYVGKIDFKLGMGRTDGDTISETDSFTVKISDLSFVTTATIPDPEYTQPAPTQKPTEAVKPTTENTDVAGNTTGQTDNSNNNGTGNQNSGAAVNGNQNTADATSIDIAVQKDITPARGKIKSLKSKKKRRVKISIKKQANVSGYQIKYSTSKKFFGYYTKKIKTNTYTFKKLKSKSRYYFKVRAFSKQNGKTYYGKWSKVKKIKVK